MTRLLDSNHPREIPSGLLGKDFRPEAILVGLGLTGSLVTALSADWRLDLCDYDAFEGGQSLLPTATREGANKAVQAAEYRGRHFPWLPAGLVVEAEVEALGGGYWRELAAGGGLILACTDSVRTQGWLSETAARHGLPYVSTGLGREGYEVLVAPPGGAGYCCLGRREDRPRTPCVLRGVSATPLNGPQPPATNSAPGIAAMAAATALHEAGALLSGGPGETVLITDAPGGPTLRSRVPRSAGCRVCSRMRPAPTPIEAVDAASGSSFEEIGNALGGAGGWMAHVPAAVETAVCMACRREHILEHFLVVGRRIICGVCGADDVVGAPRPPCWVALDEVADHTPQALGWPWAPLMRLRRDDTEVHITLARDTRRVGRLRLEPARVGGGGNENGC